GLAFGINERGDIVGYRRYATLWRGTRAIDLGPFPGGFDSAAFGINNNGRIVGGSAVGNSVLNHAAVWDHGTVIDLDPAATLSSFARSINEAGQIVGAAIDHEDFQHAVLW